MQKTLNLLSNLIIKEQLDLTLEEIATAYRGSLDPSLLAVAFKKTYNLINATANRYYGLNSDDIASYALEKLDTCLITFDGGQAKFITYFTTTLKNKFREETQALNTYKRKAVFYSNSYEHMVENGYDVLMNEEPEDIILSDLQEYELTNNELRYCGMVMQEFSNAEISAKLEVSVMTLSNMRKKLRQKLSPLAFNF